MISMQTSLSLAMSWPDLKCFQHCDRNANILCCTVPHICPVCRQDTSTTPMRIPPYILPSPFVASSKAPCSIVLKPTSGDFVSQYTSTADLHIGLTDSTGTCYDFDEDGLHIGSMWQQCIAVNMVPQTGEQKNRATSHWDQSLVRFADPRFWTVYRYNERDCNCFDFVLQFLKFSGLRDAVGNRVLTSKQSFCEEFLQQRTVKAAHYVKVYRKVLKDGFVLDVVVERS